MSTISSNADINTKYQRIATEYAKLKSQIPILKSAVISEQAKTKKLTEELHRSESAVRRLEGENEGLEFRNGQLLRRVESLQAEVDIAAQQHSSKKKGASAARNSPRVEHPKSSNSLLEGELLAKVRENEDLHSKIFEMESAHEKQLAALVAKCSLLEDENSALKAEMDLRRQPHLQKPLSGVNGNSLAGGQPAGVSNGYACSSEEMSASDGGTVHAFLVDTTRRASIVFASFASFLQLLEQRSGIYPNDRQMEPLPNSTIRYGRSLLRNSEQFEVAANQLESIASRATEDDRVDVTLEVCSLVAIFRSIGDSTKEWKTLFEEGVACENRLSWSGPSLCRSNEEWKVALSSFIELFVEAVDHFTDDERPSLEHFCELAERLSLLSSECSRTFTKKMFDENRVPTASKRLRCVNECIEKCLVSISRNLANLVALLSLIASSLHAHRIASTNITSNCISEGTVIDNAVKDTQEASTETDSFLETKTSEEEELPSPSHSRDIAASELEVTKERVVELEKERERLIVDIELLKMKLNDGALSRGDSTEVDNPHEDQLLEFVCTHYEQRVGELVGDSYYARSRAAYFQNECEDLLRCAKLAVEDRDSACGKLEEANRKIVSLHDDLETTQKGYEEQMRSLYEHMSELNAKIESQSETINSLKGPANGITPAKQGSRKLLFK